MIRLIDTDIVNYIVKELSPVTTRYEESMEAGDRFVLSPVVHFEVVRYFRLSNRTRLYERYLALTQAWMPISLDNQDWDSAIDLWAMRHRLGAPITDADLLIAVCALRTDATLVTNNERHFEGLGLTIENWAAE